MIWRHVQGGRLIDVAQACDSPADLWIQDGRIAPAGARPPAGAAVDVVDATGLAILPVLVDLDAGAAPPLHAVPSYRSAALAGATTQLVLDGGAPGVPPAWLSALDGPRRHADGAPVGMWQLNALGSDHLDQVLHGAAQAGRTVWIRSGMAPAERHGVMAQGPYALRLGLPGLSRDVLAHTVHTVLDGVRRTGARVHIRAVATAEVVDAIRTAKKDNLPVTCDVQAHHLHLTDVDVGYFDTRHRLCSPLFSSGDREALSAAVRDGTIDAVTSGHVEVSREDKEDFFSRAPAGAPSLGLTLSLAWSWAQRERVDVREMLRALTIGPAQILRHAMAGEAPGAPVGTSPVEARGSFADEGGWAPGMPADFCLVDLDAWWSLEKGGSRPYGGRSPFTGMFLPGRVVATYVAGRAVGEPAC